MSELNRWCRALFFCIGGCVLGLTALADPDTPRSGTILEQLALHGDTDAATDAANRHLLQTALFRPATDTQAFAEAGFVSALTGLISDAQVEDPAGLTAHLLTRPAFARELAYLADPGTDDLPRVFELFLKLDEAFGEDVNIYPGLAAALCVVHDRVIVRQINENKVHATDPVALFRFYRDHEKQMLFGLRDVPGSLLVWVVDSTESIPQMTWALDHFAGDHAVGRRFFDIDYDYDHFRNGTPKKVTAAGFNLANIQKYGGVCADQAYFAVSVGKAIGVPSTYTWGMGGDVAHAWVGYFEQRGKSGGWNFSEGRYTEYQGVRGHAEHPQLGVMVDDSYISVLAEAITLPPNLRYAADGMVRAATLMAIADQVHALNPEDVAPLTQDGMPAARAIRTTDLQDRLDLIEQALRIDPGHTAGWFTVAQMAKTQLNDAQKKKWAESVIRLCGDRYPDFAVAVLRPILASISDPQTQSRIWDNALQRFKSRKDVAAEIRLLQGQLWEEAKNYKQAAEQYEDIIRRYANDGPFVLKALERFEALLNTAGRGDRVLVLYRETFNTLDLPNRMASQFAQQSNYFKVGSIYAGKLDEQGDARAARRVRAEIAYATGLQVGKSSR